jgi:hypothetical protein
MADTLCSGRVHSRNAPNHCSQIVSSIDLDIINNLEHAPQPQSIQPSPRRKLSSRWTHGFQPPRQDDRYNRNREDWYVSSAYAHLFSEPFPGLGLCTGRILSHGFGANVIGYDLYPNEKAAAENGIKYVPLDELFKTSDVISLHCPLTTETKYLINNEVLKLMKPGTAPNQHRVR